MAPYILIPLIGYLGLWLVRSALFLAYFKLFGIPIKPKEAAAMLQRLPASLSIVTVFLCSAGSFYVTTKVVLAHASIQFGFAARLLVGLISLASTIVLDILNTVVGEKINIRGHPLNAIYAGRANKAKARLLGRGGAVRKRALRKSPAVGGTFSSNMVAAVTPRKIESGPRSSA